MLKIRKDHGRLADSFGRFIWWVDDGDGVYSISLDAIETRELFQRASDFGVKARDLDWIRLTVKISSSRSYERPTRDLCKILSRMKQAGDPFIRSHETATFDLKENNWRWLSALDWFSLYRPQFSYYKLGYPHSGVVLVDSDTQTQRIFPGCVPLDETNSAAIHLDDVTGVSGSGKRWCITLNNGDTVTLDWKTGLTAEFVR